MKTNVSLAEKIQFQATEAIMADRNQNKICHEICYRIYNSDLHFLLFFCATSS